MTESAAARRARRLRALGQELAAAQDAAGLTAAELGAKVGQSPRQVRRVRRGENLTAAALFDLCDALDLDLVLLRRRRPLPAQLAPGPGELTARTRAAVARVEQALDKLDKDEARAVRLLPAILGRLTPEERRALLGV